MTAIGPLPSAKSHSTEEGGFSAAVYPCGKVVLSGELDIACVDALRAALDQALFEGAELILVDASELLFIDSVALSELLRYQLAAVSRQRRICLEPVSGPVADVLDLLDLSPVLIVRS